MKCKTAFFVVVAVSVCMCAAGSGDDAGDGDTLHASGFAAKAGYDLFRWAIGPVALGVVVSVGLVARNLHGRRKRAAHGFTEIGSRGSFPMILLILLALYSTSLFFGLIYGRTIGTAGISISPEQTAALENVFGPMRESLREGAPKTIVSVAAIVLAINVLGSVIQGTVLGLLLIPIVPFLAYIGWGQGVTMAGLEASTLMSAWGFICVGCLESVTYVICSAAGVHMGLSFMFPAWSKNTTRRDALHRSFKTALKAYCVVVVILIAAALIETFYVRQVLLHGGSGIPLLPY